MKVSLFSISFNTKKLVYPSIQSYFVKPMLPGSAGYGNSSFGYKFQESIFFEAHPELFHERIFKVKFSSGQLMFVTSCPLTELDFTIT